MKRLYTNFTRQTGIKINRIEAKEDELLERIRNEGRKARPTSSLRSMPLGSPKPTSWACLPGKVKSARRAHSVQLA
jgi:hypothetical protein